MEEINETIIAYKYKPISRIGGGQFGHIYKGINIKSKETIALKLESKRTQYKMLKRETTIMKYLYEHNCRNIPCVHWFGQIDNFMCTVMPLYECSLHHYIQVKKLNEKQLDSIMLQCIRILESIHKNMVLHRDIKPQNIMVKNGELYLIDFGLATFYIGDNKLHLPNKVGDYITGTPKYVSQHIHNGCRPSRRDELLSLGYLYIYIYANELPWDSVYNDPDDDQYPSEIHIMHSKNKQRRLLKNEENMKTICERINPRIENYFRFCNSYDYFDDPQYISLCSLFIHDNN
jgi:serine/threonine protein kinase